MEVDELKALLSDVLGDRKIVTDISVTNLLPPGENFMSSILGIRAKIQETSNAKSTKAEAANGKRVTEKEEELHLVAKIPLPTADGYQDIFAVDYVFEKEVFFYKEIFPKYRQMLDGTTLKCDITAHYYGSRLDSKESTGEFKGCILFENLKTLGYIAGDRQKGLNIEDAKIPIEKLAVFHATGIAIKKLRPSVFDTFRGYCTNRLPEKMEQFETWSKDTFERLRKDDVLQKYLPKYLKNIKSFQDAYKQVSSEPWVTIVHMDSWMNNMMFRNHEGLVEDVKIVDFQSYCLGSPMRDLLRFVFSSVNFEAVSMEAADQMIDLYYRHFIDALKILLKCEDSNLAEFSRDHFDKQIIADIQFELLHIILTNKILLLDYDNLEGDKNDRSTYAGAPPSDSCIKKFRKIMAYFDKKHWI